MRVVPALDVLEDGMRAAAGMAKRCRSSSPHSSVRKKLSHLALSYASPTEPIDGRTPSASQRRRCAVPDLNYRVFWLVREGSGLHAGENTAVQVKDIDWQTRTLHIERAFSHGRLGPTNGEERTVA